MNTLFNHVPIPAVALPPPPPRNRAERRNVLRAMGAFKRRGRKW